MKHKIRGERLKIGYIFKTSFFDCVYEGASDSNVKWILENIPKFNTFGNQYHSWHFQYDNPVLGSSDSLKVFLYDPFLIIKIDKLEPKLW